MSELLVGDVLRSDFAQNAEAGLVGVAHLALPPDRRRKVVTTAAWLAVGTGLVALTGYGRPLDRAAAMAAGFDHHLTKPPNPVELSAALRAAAAARRPDPPARG